MIDWKIAKRDDNGLIISLEPTEEEAKSLATFGTEPADKLHTTLAYFDRDKTDIKSLHDIARQFASSLEPMKGEIGGLANFGEKEDGQVPHVGLVQVPDLTATRTRLINNLKDQGFPLSDKYNFIPHLTFHYGKMDDTPDSSVIGHPLTFNNLTVRAGDDATHYPLGGITKSSADKPNWVYFNGQVALGPHTHMELLKNLTDKFPGPLYNSWIANYEMPHGLDCDVARGHIDKGHPVFWESNVDRNTVQDAVYNKLGS